MDFDAAWCALGHCGQFVGFMERNKWDYDELVIEGENWAQLKRLLESAVANPSNEALQAVFDFMQGLWPK